MRKYARSCHRCPARQSACASVMMHGHGAPPLTNASAAEAAGGGPAAPPAARSRPSLGRFEAPPEDIAAAPGAALVPS